MKDTNKQLSIAEKERTRRQIIEHVEAFLRAGGKIDVLGNGGSAARVRAGIIWHDDVESVQRPE